MEVIGLLTLANEFCSFYNIFALQKISDTVLKKYILKYQSTTLHQLSDSPLMILNT